MENVYSLSDLEISGRISAKLKEIRLKQNISRRELAESSGVSMASIARMEDGEIRSFELFLRILRTLGKIEVLLPLLQEEDISPADYYKMVQAQGTKRRKRASKSRIAITKEEESAW